MKKTVKVIGVRRILKDANGNPLNIFVLEIPNKPAIVRSAKEFLTDLKNSFLIGEHVVNPNHPELLSVLQDLNVAPFTITGTITDAKKGEMWVVTENSRVITDRSHPKYGEVSTGDKLPYEKDMTLVTDGFLNVSLNPQVAQQNKIALSTGQAMASMLSTYDEVVSESASYGTSDAPEFDVTDIPDNILQEATAGNEDKKN